MKRENSQKENNIHIINDNIYKIPFKREAPNSRAKNKNLTFRPNKNNTETSFNDINNINNLNKLPKGNSFSKESLPKNNNEKRSRPKIKKGKSTACLKSKDKDKIDRNLTMNNHTIKKNSNLTPINMTNKNNNNNFKKIKDNIKNNSISLSNTQNNYNTNNLNKSNLNINNKNNNTNNFNEKKKFQFIPKIAPNIEEKSQNVKVFIRFRPSNELETSLLQSNYGWLVPKFISEKQLGIYTKNSYEYNQPNSEIPKNYIFSYDKVFSPDSNQSEIYVNVGKRIVEDIMSGYNGTIFAYGQSGSGKTYTMYGNDLFDENLKGIIPRIVEEIFNRVEKSDNNIDFQIKLSVMEIYKEVIFDLFTQENNLKIIENKEKGIYIENLSEVYLSSIEEFFNYVELSQKNRKVSETRLNHNSSRSHCIMILEVIQNYKKEKIIKKGILNLVDLAGSEKVSKTGAVGETLEEAKKINLSLSTLGNVIHSITQGMGHIPYRDSKLTRILKESLGGNYKTYLIVTCSPHSYNLDEIISSLLFAKRVKCIKNKYRINIKYSYEELQNLVDQLNDKLIIANDKIYKLLKGEKINLNEENKDNKKEIINNSFLCKNCNLLSKEKKILENKVQELMDTIQEKDSEIFKLKEELKKYKNKNKNNKDYKDNNKYNNNNNLNNLNNLNTIQEVDTSNYKEENKNEELLELYKKIKDKLSKIEEENERIKIIQNEEEEIRKINLKKESFNKIIQDFIRNKDKDKLKCFEKIDSIIKVSIPYVKEKDYNSLFNEYKKNIYDIFAESFMDKNNNNNNIPTKKLLDIIVTNLFFEYLRFYFSEQIINQGYLKLILDNNSLHKMNKFLFDIIRDVLSENVDIANENAMNANAINYIRASIRDSFISKPNNNNNMNMNMVNDLNQKIIKVVPKKNLSIKSSFRINNLNNLNNALLDNNNININSLRSSLQGLDFKNSFAFCNDNYAAYINKLKSQEYEKSSNKIQMIRNVLVSIIKETDYIRNDIKELKENLNITIKDIMNYFSKKILKNDLIELDINNNKIYEKNNDVKVLKSKFLNELNNNNNNNEINNKVENQNEFIKNNNKKIIKIFPDKKINNNYINQTYDSSLENINPNTNDINKTNTFLYSHLIGNSSSSLNINKNMLNRNNSNNSLKNKNILSKLVKQNTNIFNENKLNKISDEDIYAITGKNDKVSIERNKLNQAKGDLVDNANYFILTKE